MSKKKTIILLSAIVGFAAAVRLIGVLMWDGLIFDEIFSVSIASQPLSEMWTYLRWELHPPLHFLYLKGWLAVFGNNEVIIRLSSVLIGLFSVVAMYLLASTVFQSRRTGLWAAFLVSVSVGVLIHSIIARMYGPIFLLGILSFYFFWQAVNDKQPASRQAGQKTNKKRHAIHWILYILITLLALYTHLTAPLILLTQLIYLLYLRRKQALEQSIFKKFFMAAALYTLAYLPWFFNFIITRLSTISGNSWFFYKKLPDIFFLNIPLRFLVGNTNVDILSLVALLLFTAAGLSALVHVRRTGRGRWQVISRVNEPLVFSLFTLFIPLMVLVALKLNAARFYMLPFIGVVLLVSAGLADIGQRLPSRAAKVFLVTVMALFLVPVLMIISPDHQPWQKMARFIEDHERPGDKIVTAYSANLLTINYYYQGDLESQAFADPEIRKQVSNDLELVVRTNFVIDANRQNVKEFENIVGEAERVFFVFDRDLFGGTFQVFVEWFIDNGWRRVDWLEGKQKKEVWLLEKPQEH